MPINRFHSPEAIGVGAEIEYRNMGFSNGILDFSNNSTSNPLLMSTSQDGEFYLGLGISKRADLFVRVAEESSSQVGVKVQLLGEPSKKPAPGHKLSFSLGMGNERDEFDQAFVIDLKSEVTDISFIHGYRTSPYFMIYDGISVSSYSFEGKIQGATGLDSNEIDYSAKNIIGAHIGAILGSHTFKLKLEYATQKIEWTNTEEKLFQYFALALGAGW